MSTPLFPPRVVRFSDPPQAPKVPSKTELLVLLQNGMTDAVQQILNMHPDVLKYKIENGELVDIITGPAVYLKRFVTQDEDTIQMKKDAELLMDISDEVLITGETGTGKELIANAMLGKRDGKFIPVNCAGLPENLIESELFGHRAGAFTGAVKDKEGMMSTARNGVLFLDEIGELPISVQGKLLRALQSKTIRPVGANEEREISCRFVCATHRNLLKMIERNEFRQDLFARISTFHLNIKPLRERKKDIPLIISSLGERLKIPGKSMEFLTVYKNQLENLDLSLNVRSLEQALKRFNVLGRI